MDARQRKSELLALRDEIKQRVERTHRHLFQKSEPVSANFNEQIKETENDDLVRVLDAEGVEEIARIDEALRRIEEGSYAYCKICGEEIEAGRLVAIPYATSCISCAQGAA